MLIFYILVFIIVDMFQLGLQLDKMANFIQAMFLASNTKLPSRLLLSLTFFVSGCALGVYKSKLQQKFDSYPSQSQAPLHPYISQQHLNHSIEQTKRPAVIYYYQPSQFHHYIVRHGFIRSSYLCRQKGDFYMVNLTKKLEKAMPEIQHVFPIQEYMIEIRFPKQECQVGYTDGTKEKKVINRREFFNCSYKRSGGVENFMEENGLLDVKEPIQDFVKLTKNCLFSPIPQEQ